MLQKSVEQRSSLSEVLKSPVLLPYIRQLRKEREAKLKECCCRRNLQTAHSLEETRKISRITEWNPLEGVEDNTVASEIHSPLKFSLSMECVNPFEVSEDPPSPTSELRSHCISTLGESLFSSVYTYLSTQRSQRTYDDIVTFTSDLGGLTQFRPSISPRSVIRSGPISVHGRKT